MTPAAAGFEILNPSQPHQKIKSGATLIIININQHSVSRSVKLKAASNWILQYRETTDDGLCQIHFLFHGWIVLAAA